MQARRQSVGVICTCVPYVRAHVCGIAQMYVWHVHMSGVHWVSCIMIFCLTHLKQDFLLNLDVGWQPVSASHFCASLQHRGCRNMPLACFISVEIQTQILCCAASSATPQTVSPGYKGSLSTILLTPLPTFPNTLEASFEQIHYHVSINQYLLSISQRYYGKLRV